MRVFEKANWVFEVCPICNTDKKGPVTLIAIAGTEKGYNAEARQVHLDCLDLRIDEENKVIFQKWEDGKSHR